MALAANFELLLLGGTPPGRDVGAACERGRWSQALEQGLQRGCAMRWFGKLSNTQISRPHSRLIRKS